MLVGEERIYGGIFLDAVSQMPIDFPVVRCAMEDERSCDSLPSSSPACFNTDPAVDAKAGGDRPGDVPSDMTDYFCKWAMGPHAVENRKLLQDSRIHQWLAAAGKPSGSTDSSLALVRA